MKFEGTYASVFNINESRFYCKKINQQKTVAQSIGLKDIVKKYNVDILGELGGAVRCSEPLPCIGEKKSP